jgi:hypothetical protein
MTDINKEQKSTNELERLQAEEARIRIEDAKLELELKKADLKRRIAENSKHENKEANQTMQLKERAQAFADAKTTATKKQARCTHRMGGNDKDALASGLGDSDMFCVAKTKLPSGDVMIRCQRCAKTWIPPLESDFHDISTGKLDRESFDRAQKEYVEAYNMKTSLAMSVMPQFRKYRNGKPINREVTHQYVRNV